MEKNLPQTKFRAGAICATVWQNENTGKDGQPTSYFSVSLERAYKDKKDEWQTTHSFRTADLPKVEVVIRKAFEYLVLQQAA